MLATIRLSLRVFCGLAGLLKMIISRGFRLIEHVFDLNPPCSFGNPPFNDISHRVAEDNGSDGGEDRQLAGFNVSILGKDQRENHRPVLVNIKLSHSGVHGYDFGGKSQPPWIFGVTLPASPGRLDPDN